MATRKAPKRRDQDEPTIVEMNIYNMVEDEWDTTKFRVRRVVSPKALLRMQEFGTNDQQVTIPLLIEFWRALLVEADADRMAMILDSDDMAFDMTEMGDAYLWVLGELGIRKKDEADPKAS